MFDPASYGAEIAAILSIDGNGGRLMPLASPTCVSAEARDRIDRAELSEFIRAGLYLYYGCWSQAHELVDDSDAIDGKYWHAIIHRQEPDPGNSGYWFRQVGQHPLFPILREQAQAMGYSVGNAWDPFGFVAYCGRAQKGSNKERIARQVQQVEWQLLFDRSARR